MSHPHKSTSHEEMFFHIREPHVSRKGKKFKAATVFARQDGVDGFWLCTIARCSEEDNFSREQGRSITRRKYFTLAGDSLVKPDRPTKEDVVAFYKDI